MFNFMDDFRERVICRFISSYEKGITPNPCIDCNIYMKFDRLLKRALILDCEYVVTGHYARITQSDGKFFLRKALDDTKDQSYVLYSLTQEQLKHIQFPLGEMRKKMSGFLQRKTVLLLRESRTVRTSVLFRMEIMWHSWKGKREGPA